MFKKRSMNKKGVVTFYLVFIIIAIIVIVLTAFVAPLGAEISTRFYVAGGNILNRANATIANISDVAIRTQIQDTFISAQAAQQNNIEVGAALFQYSWIIVLILVATVIFLLARRTVEYNGLA